MKNRFVSFVAAVGVVVTAPAVKAQHYPNRNVTMIVPYPAGGPTDETARIVAQSLSNQLKQSFIVEDIGGGGSIIGSEKVARATPDGYTLLVHNLQISANVTLYKALPFDTLKVFAPVMLINRNPLILVGRNTLVPKQRFPATVPLVTSPLRFSPKKPVFRSIKFLIVARRRH